MTKYELATIIILAVTAIGGLGLLVAGIVQLRELVQQVTEATEANKLGRLNALLTLEQAMAEKRFALSEAGIALAELGKAPDSPEKKSRMEVAKLRLDEAKQMYLNSLDRLCYCLLRGLLKEEELRADYRRLIEATVNDFRADLGVGTEYRNVTKLHEKWADT